MATSAPPTCPLDAALPKETAPPAGEVYRFVVESSIAPQIVVDRGASGRFLAPDPGLQPTAPSARRQDVLVFPGERLEHARIWLFCESDGCGSDFPGDDYVRVVGPSSSPAWSMRTEGDVTVRRTRPAGEHGVQLEVTLEPIDVVFPEKLAPGSGASLRFEVIPEASRDASRIGVVSVTQTYDRSYTVNVTPKSFVRSIGYVAPDASAPEAGDFESDRWRVAAVLDGLCAESPCVRPNVNLRIVAIDGTSPPRDGGP
ncbi:hypothetical protein LZC95_25820 [Pendulispora brunnea]|uniref:Uncharacterized protein n=1 Tax=Pendulispora brunnea TaxID=2905690 RepID=A0ABZ2JTV9_9BACT